MKRHFYGIEQIALIQASAEPLRQLAKGLPLIGDLLILARQH